MPHRVLIIDDSQTVLASLSSGLKGDGYDVETLSQFMDLAKTLETFRPQVIILDLLMPGFSGVQFARFVHQFCEEPPPILLHSGSDPEMVRIAAREIRPFEIITKGSPQREIRRAVGRAVAQSRGWTGSRKATSTAASTSSRSAFGAARELSRGTSAQLEDTQPITRSSVRFRGRDDGDERATDRASRLGRFGDKR